MKVKYYDIPEQRKCVAVTIFAGKTVRGVAKAAPEDEYNPEIGRSIAFAKLKEKVAAKKEKLMRERYEQLNQESIALSIRKDRMKDRVIDAGHEYEEALDNLNAIMKHYS